MISSFYTASTGAIQLQKNMDVVANNIANVSTTGFKKDKGSFVDLLYTNIRQPEGDSTLKKGHGTRLQKVDTVFTQGTLQVTDSKLDFAIEDNSSYFAVETSTGIKYTRNGSFHLSNENGKSYLVSSVGNGYVLDRSGHRMTATSDDLENGNLDFGLSTFANQTGLQKQAGTFFVPTTNSGAATAVPNPSSLLKQGSLESSSVEMGQEMTDMILTQRAFQFNTKIVQTADEIMQTINTLR